MDYEPDASEQCQWKYYGIIEILENDDTIEATKEKNLGPGMTLWRGNACLPWEKNKHSPFLLGRKLNFHLIRSIDFANPLLQRLVSTLSNIFPCN